METLKMATVTAPTTETRLLPSIVIHDLSWDDYEAMLKIVGNRPIRINYDRGSMEIMSPIQHHGSGSYLLGSMVDILIDELDIPYEPVDPVTYRRPDLGKGVEPDKAYHFRENAERVRGRRKLDLTIDPPPDLVIEVDVTASSIPRLPIFAALGIPEVWRLEGEDLLFLQLQLDGTYQTRDHSLAFPTFPLADAARFLEQGQTSDKKTWIRQFRAYVHEVLVPQQPRPDDAQGR
jgi:Uma2 family endonuclease